MAKKFIKVSLQLVELPSTPIGTVAYDWPAEDKVNQTTLKDFVGVIKPMLPDDFPFHFVTKEGHPITQQELLSSLKPADVADDGVLYVAEHIIGYW